MAQRIEWVTEPPRFTSLAEEWDALARRHSTPFVRHAWFSAWWAAFGAGRPLRVCLLWEDARLVAAFPLFAARRGRLSAMANVHSPLFRPLARDDEALEGLSVSVARAGAPELEVPALAVDDLALAVLTRVLERERRTNLVEPQETSPLTDTSGDLEAYRREKKSKLREVERRRRKLLREHRVELTLIERPRDLEVELQRGLEVEASGWKGEAGTAILSSEDTTRFYRSVARAYHESGDLRFSGLSVDGRLVAFDYAILHGGRYHLLKTGYDESLRRLGPGLALRLAVIERCFELGLAAHEFLGEAYDWKLMFATGEREHRMLRSYRRRPVAMLRHQYRRRARPLLRRAYRRVRGRESPG